MGYEELANKLALKIARETKAEVNPSDITFEFEMYGGNTDYWGDQEDPIVIDFKVYRNGTLFAYRTYESVPDLLTELLGA